MHRRAKSAIRDLVLDLRETLEGEIERELRRYGIYPERDWLPADELGHLSKEERTAHRPRIEAAIARERDAGLDQAEAVEAYVREAAYTHMNRLLGLKCMETRGLIEETITTRPIYSERSKRHRNYLDDHPGARRAPDRGLIPMLREAYTEVSQYIGVVFDPDSDYTVIWPRHKVLKDSIDDINALDGNVARKLDRNPDAMPSIYADDTFLGWVYQYFQEEEKDRVFRELRTKKKKIGGYDIVPATTIYTEHYMVQFLVDNSLGALWMEMYPASDLCEGWDYFVEDPNLQNDDGTQQRGREPRPVAELSLLDPACGSGHFMLYAFDLFAQMYEAEAQMEGQPVDRPAIARRILRQNLHGIDIDLRSIQLSALNLYMKACTYADLRLNQLQNGEPVQMNLACADIVLREGPELEELLGRFENDPLTQELIETIWQGLQNARELGSLLKVEEQIDEVIARKREAEKGTFWEHPEDLWEQWKRDFLETLKSYVDRATEAFDVNRRMFGQEAIKGVQLLDLLTQRYDVVTTNPPYMGSWNIKDSLLQSIKALYPEASTDLYACFIERCEDFVLTSGMAAMITQQTFLFLRSYSELREWWLSNVRIRSLAHLGPHAFEAIGGEIVNTVMFVFRKSASQGKSLGRYIDLTDATSKFENLKAYASTKEESSGLEFIVDQSQFSSISTAPIAYWISERIFEVYRSAPALDDGTQDAIARCRRGVDTANVRRFVRYIWEIPDHLICWNHGTSDCHRRWHPHLRGGGFSKWYGNLHYAILWGTDGKEVKSTENAIVPNEEFYFRQGITFTRISSRGFSARLFPSSFLISDAGSGIFTDAHRLYYLLGYLNSSLAAHFLKLMNPTMNFQTGDINRLPYASPAPTRKQVITELVRECVDDKKWLISFEPNEIHFEESFIEAGLRREGDGLESAYRHALVERENRLGRLLVNEGAIDQEVFKAYEVEDRVKNRILREQGIPVSSYPLLAELDADLGMLAPGASNHLERLQRQSIEDWAIGYEREQSSQSSSDPQELLESEFMRMYAQEDLPLRELCERLKTNPVSLVALRRQMDLVSPDDLKHEVENFLTHRIWELSKQDEDGIIPYADGLRNPPLLDQVRGEIEDVFGAENAVSIETEMDEILGRGGLAHWLENPFFKKHRSQFKRRPILWHVTSRDKHFRVLVYYQKLDRDTLPKVRSQYLWPQLERARARLRAAKMEEPPDVKTIGEMEEIIADLEDCDERLERVIQGDVDVDLPGWAVGPYRGGTAPYDPDLDDGVKVNILPLQAARLLPYKRVV